MKIRSPFAPHANRTLLVDLVAMIALAIGVGLASAIILGGTVLLLSDEENAIPAIVAPVSSLPVRAGDPS